MTHLSRATGNDNTEMLSSPYVHTLSRQRVFLSLDISRRSRSSMKASNAIACHLSSATIDCVLDIPSRLTPVCIRTTSSLKTHTSPIVTMPSPLMASYKAAAAQWATMYPKERPWQLPMPSFRQIGTLRTNHFLMKVMEKKNDWTLWPLIPRNKLERWMAAELDKIR